MKPEFSFKQYLPVLAQKLRRYECERARGNLNALENIEQPRDEALLQKWGWISTIGAVVVAFFVMPFVTGVLQSFLPALISNFFWAVTKGLMGMSLIMVGLSIYFTIGQHSDKR